MTQPIKFRAYNTFEICNDLKKDAYQLSPGHTTGTIWITNKAGGGAEMPVSKFYEVVDKFFKENF